MRRLLVWLAVGGALVVYLSVSSGIVGVGGGQATPEPVQLVAEPGVAASSSPATSGKPVTSPVTSTPGPSPTPLPAGVLAGQGETFVLVNAGTVTHDARVGLTGQGFKPGEPLSISLRGEAFGAEREVGRAFANKEGRLENVAFQIPTDLPPGRYVVQVMVSKGGRVAQTNFELAGGQPGLEPDVYAARPGAKVRFAGGGFQPGERISVYFDSLGTDPLGTVEASQSGTVRLADVPVPLSPEGQHAFVFVGERSQRPVRVPFSVTGLYPWIVVDNYTPLPQASVGVSGEDFYSGERVRIYLNEVGPTPAAVTVAAETGAIGAAAAVAIPGDVRGAAVVIAVGEQSGARATTELAIQDFSPVLELTSYAGKAGDTTSLTGSSFVPGETLRAYLGRSQSGQEVSSFQVGSDGGFKGAGAFVVPYGTPPGQLAITIVGEQSKTPVTVEYAVLPFTPWAGLSSYAGPVGSQVSFLGGSFAPGEIVDVHLGDARGKVVLSATTDDEGKFALTDPYTIAGGASDVTFTLVGETSRASVSVKYKVVEGGPGESGPADETPGSQPTPSQSTPSPMASPSSTRALLRLARRGRKCYLELP